MKNKVYFLKDSEINDWLVEGFENLNFPIIFYGISNGNPMFSKSRIFRIFSLHTKYIRLSLKGLFKSQKDDIIITFLDVIGLYLVVISKIFFLKRKFIVINIMFNDNNDIISRIKKKAFRFMLKDSRVFPTITAAELNDIYRKMFNLPHKNFSVLNDCYGKLESYKSSYKNNDGYVFCGGSNGRDWSTLVKVATLLPHIPFIIVGPNKNVLGEVYPDNIDFYYDIPYNQFMLLMAHCSLLALPLNTDAPAGLIVMFSAGLLSKAIVTTDNVAMREYIKSEVNGTLVKKGDFEEFARRVNILFLDIKKQEEYGNKLHDKIEELGSPDAYVKRVIKIVSQVRDV